MSWYPRPKANKRYWSEVYAEAAFVRAKERFRRLREAKKHPKKYPKGYTFLMMPPHRTGAVFRRLPKPGATFRRRKGWISGDRLQGHRRAVLHEQGEW